MLTRSYSLHTQNLEHYVSYLARISGWEIHEIGNAKIVFNGSGDSLFNYVFCDNTTTEENVRDVLDFLKDKNWEMTWPVEPNFHNLRHVLEKYNLSRVSNPKKAYIEVDRFYFMPDLSLDLEFNLVKDEETISQFDRSASQIFHHKEGVVSLFLRGLSGRGECDLKSFIVKLDNQIVGLCSMFISNGNAGFYADGVYKNFRHRQIGSHMVAKRIEIAKKNGCKSVIAHCMSQSVNMYERLGFRMLSTLYLYVSEP